MRPTNPFRPGFNQPPPFLAGRDDILAAAEEAMAVVEDQWMPTPLMLQGPRGVGKTVLLAEIARRAAEVRGWPWVQVELRPRRAFTPALVDATTRTQALLADAAPARAELRAAVLKAQLAGVGAELHLARPAAEPLDASLALASSFRRLAEAAIDKQAGVVLTLDEAQLGDRDELGDLAATLQEGVQAAWPLVTLIAGLPTMSRPDHFPTYFERADWLELGSLDVAATIAALSHPAAEAGRPFEPGAAALLAARTGGYPYAIQVFGQHAWRSSQGETSISAGSVRNAVDSAEHQLTGFHQRRWSALPKGERDYARTVAELGAQNGGLVAGAEVARRLGKSTQALSSYRDRLLRRGILVDTGGGLGFALPGTQDYILTHPDAAPPPPPAGEPRKDRRREP